MDRGHAPLSSFSALWWLHQQSMENQGQTFFHINQFTAQENGNGYLKPKQHRKSDGGCAERVRVRESIQTILKSMWVCHTVCMLNTLIGMSYEWVNTLIGMSYEWLWVKKTLHSLILKKNIVLLVQRMPHCCSLRINDMAKYSGKQWWEG